VSGAAAARAFQQYQAGGPSTQLQSVAAQLNILPVRRAERIRNVTLAWYYEPTNADEAALRSALHFHARRGGELDYTGLWAIPGALIDPSASASLGSASYGARLVLAGGCVAGECGVAAAGCTPGPLGDDLEVAIWPSPSLAESYVREYKKVMVSDERFERIKNATISWDCRPTSSVEALVRGAFH
jgi:hypothetical protein